jgi:hypothetical protein
MNLVQYKRQWAVLNDHVRQWEQSWGTVRQLVGFATPLIRRLGLLNCRTDLVTEEGHGPEMEHPALGNLQCFHLLERRLAAKHVEQVELVLTKLQFVLVTLAECVAGMVAVQQQLVERHGYESDAVDLEALCMPTASASSPKKSTPKKAMGEAQQLVLTPSVAEYLQWAQFVVKSYARQTEDVRGVVDKVRAAAADPELAGTLARATFEVSDWKSDEIALLFGTGTV